MISTDRMIDTRNATLNQGPEALDAIGIDIVGSANFGAVVNAKMPISKPLHSVIGREFVCIEGSSRSYMLRHKRNKSGTIHIGNDFGGYFAIPLGCTDNFRFVLCTSPTLACSFTTDIRFVNFHLTLQVLEIFIKEGSYLLTHSPSRLIGNACFTLDLLGRDTTPGRSHSVHNLKPSPEWGSRLMEDSESSSEEYDKSSNYCPQKTEILPTPKCISIKHRVIYHPLIIFVAFTSNIKNVASICD